MAQRLGHADPAELIGKTDIDLFGEAFGQRIFLEDQRIIDSGEPLVGLVESRPLGGAVVNWTLTTKSPLRDASGVTVGLIGITSEINEIKRTELDLQHLATHDTTTGLPNRYLLIDRLSQVLAHSKREGTSFAVLFVDIDDFKAVNDEHGHEFGDLVLQAMARRSSRPCEPATPWPGSAATSSSSSSRASPGTTPQSSWPPRSGAALARAVTIQGRKIKATISIGISVYPDNGDDPEVLVRAADYAMYLAKRAGKNRWQACPHGLPIADTDFQTG